MKILPFNRGGVKPRHCQSCEIPLKDNQPISHFLCTDCHQLNRFFRLAFNPFRVASHAAAPATLQMVWLRKVTPLWPRITANYRQQMPDRRSTAKK